MVTLLFFSIFICTVSASTLTAPPQTALVIGFEKVYDLSLLANTLSDQGIDSVLIIPGRSGDIYENLIEVEVIKLNYTIEKSAKREEKALKACEALLSNQKVLNRVREIEPTFTIFPALRHDACLLPWIRLTGSIPVIWAEGQDDEYYAIDKSRLAIPIQTVGLLDRFWANVHLRAIVSHAESNYVPSAFKLINKYLPDAPETSLNELYKDVKLFLWGADPILRLEFASLSHRLVEIGCHHCRGAQPLTPVLQKELVEYRLGTIAVTLDEEFSSLIEKLAQQLPQGRQGQAIVWKSKVKMTNNKPENLFIHSKIDRQDLIGYSRTRVLLSHCTDTEFLEAAFHGTPVICFPRNSEEKTNALRAVQLSLSIGLNDNQSAENIFKIVDEIHQTASYREAARVVSLAIRDRPLPASDRMVFWLRFVARNRDTDIKFSPVEEGATVKILAEDLQFIYGLFMGSIFGALFAATTALTWYYQGKSSKQLGKLKPRKYNR